jgi:hypothetical protein
MRHYILLSCTLLLCLPIILPAQEVFDVSYQLKKGDVLYFNETVNTTTSQERNGEEVKMPMTTRTKTKWLVEDVSADGTITIVSSPEDIRMEAPGGGEGPRMGRGPGGLDGDMIKSMIGKRTRIVMNANGEITGSVALDPLPERRGPISAQRGPHAVLPVRPVGIGDTWKYAGRDSVNVAFTRALSKYDLILTAASKETHNNRECLKITYGGKVTLSGQGKSRGGNMSVEGSGSVTGSAWFDLAKGLVVEEETTTEQNLVMSITGEREFTMPMAQTSTTTRVLADK